MALPSGSELTPESFMSETQQAGHSPATQEHREPPYRHTHIQRKIYKYTHTHTHTHTLTQAFTHSHTLTQTYTHSHRETEIHVHTALPATRKPRYGARLSRLAAR